MEAALLDLVLDVAASLLADIAEHLREHPFERVALHGTALRLSGRRDRGEAIIADVERGAEEVATLLSGIPITLLEASHIVLRPQDTRHDNLMEWNTFYIQAVEIVATYHRKQMAGTGNEVWDAVSHPFIDAVEGIGTNIDELFPAAFGLLPIANRTDAPLLGGHNLHVLHVGEAGGIRRDTKDGVPLPAARGVLLHGGQADALCRVGLSHV